MSALLFILASNRLIMLPTCVILLLAGTSLLRVHCQHWSSDLAVVKGLAMLDTQRAALLTFSVLARSPRTSPDGSLIKLRCRSAVWFENSSLATLHPPKWFTIIGRQAEPNLSIGAFSCHVDFYRLSAFRNDFESLQFQQLTAHQIDNVENG